MLQGFGSLFNEKEREECEHISQPPSHKEFEDHGQRRNSHLRQHKGKKLPPRPCFSELSSNIFITSSCFFFLVFVFLFCRVIIQTAKSCWSSPVWRALGSFTLHKDMENPILLSHYSPRRKLERIAAIIVMCMTNTVLEMLSTLGLLTSSLHRLAFGFLVSFASVFDVPSVIGCSLIVSQIGILQTLYSLHHQTICIYEK